MREKSPITITVLLEDAPPTGMKSNSVLTVANWFKSMLVGTPPLHVLVVEDAEVVDEDDLLVEDDDEDVPGPEVREEVVLEPVLVADDDPRPELLALDVVDLVDEEEPIPVEDDVVGLADEDDVLLVLVAEPLEPEDE